MIIRIKVKTNSRNDVIKKVELENVDYIIETKESPQKGKANSKIVKLLSKYFDVDQSEIKIISGLTNKLKIVKIQ